MRELREQVAKLTEERDAALLRAEALSTKVIDANDANEREKKEKARAAQMEADLVHLRVRQWVEDPGAPFAAGVYVAAAAKDVGKGPGRSRGRWH